MPIWVCRFPIKNKFAVDGVWIPKKTLIMVHLHLLVATGFVGGWFVVNQVRDMYNIQQLKHPACYLVVGMAKLNQILRSEVIKQWE